MKRVDERDTMFARMSYDVGSNEYKDYYKRNPKKKVIDDEIRKKPNVIKLRTSIIILNARYGIFIPCIFLR